MDHENDRRRLCAKVNELQKCDASAITYLTRLLGEVSEARGARDSIKPGA
jgi:hypothetical protein